MIGIFAANVAAWKGDHYGSERVQRRVTAAPDEKRAGIPGEDAAKREQRGLAERALRQHSGNRGISAWDRIPNQGNCGRRNLLTRRIPQVGYHNQWGLCICEHSLLARIYCRNGRINAFRRLYGGDTGGKCFRKHAWEHTRRLPVRSRLCPPCQSRDWRSGWALCSPEGYIWIAPFISLPFG